MRLVAASLRETLLMLVVQVVHDLARQPEPLAALAVRPALRALLALRLLLGACLDKVEAVAAVVLLARAVPGVLAVVALVVAVVVLHAVHTQPVLAA